MHDERASETSPILEFDHDRNAIIEPTFWHQRIDGLASAAVMTWMPDAFEKLLAEWPHREVHRFQAETINNGIYEVDVPGGTVVATLSGVGAPTATALYEALIAIGCTTVIAVGSSGGLVPEYPPGTIVVPDAAIRDEGVSYHYAAPARLAHPDPELQAALRVAYAASDPVRADVWTTDALFRETSAKVAARIAEGAVAVDMEASALATVAAFRGTRHGHAVYLADTLHSDQWDPTELIERDTGFRYQLLLTAAETAVAQ